MNRTTNRRLMAVLAGLMLAALWLVASAATGYSPDAAAQDDEASEETAPATGTFSFYKEIDGPLGEDIDGFSFELGETGDAGALIAAPRLDPYGSSDIYDLAPDTYVLSELVGAARFDTEIDCYNGVTETWELFDSASATIEIVAGFDVECVVRNTDLSLGSLSVRKETNRSTGDMYDFLVAPAADFEEPAFQLGSGDSKYFTVAADNTYTITELATDANAGQLTNVTCVDDNTGETVAGGDDVREVAVTVAGGAAINCTFYNFVETGEIRLNKITNPTSSDPTPFTITVTGPITDDGPGTATEVIVDTDSDTETHQRNATIVDLAPGTYTIEETVVEGWSTTISCFGNDRDLSFDGPLATIELGRDERVTCDVFNTDASTVDIYVQKNVAPNTGVIDPTVFELQVTSANGYDSGPFNLDLNYGDDTNAQYNDLDGLPPGTYTIVETPVDGYTPSMRCTMYDQQEGTVELGVVEGASLTFDAEPGASINCTVTNTRDLALIDVHKNSRNGLPEDPEFDFTLEGPTSEAFTLGINDSLRRAQVVAGEYTLTEVLGDLADDYDTSIECSSNVGLGGTLIADVEADSVTFQAVPGDRIFCVVTNDVAGVNELGDIYVYKLLEPLLLFEREGDRLPTSGESFPFVISGPGPVEGEGPAFPQEFGLSAFGGRERFLDLQPGSYTITETDNGDYETSIECFDDNEQFDYDEGPTPIVTVESGTSATFDLAGGQELACYFTNTDAGRAIISVEKDVTPGYNDPTDFTFDIAGPEGYAETFVLDDDDLSSFVEARRIFDHLMPGDYTITEEALPGYVTAVTCYDASTFGGFGPKLRVEVLGSPFVDPIATSTNGEVSFTIEGGQTVFCDFVNRVADATLIVVKDDTGDTGTEVPVTVTERGAVIAAGVISDNGTPSTLTVPIIAGFGFTVTEMVPVGFTANIAAATCVDQDGVSIIRDESDISFALESRATPEGGEVAPTEFSAYVFGQDVLPGDTVTCTFVNDPMPGSITLVNDTAPDGPQDFSYTTTSPASSSAAALPPGIVSFAAGFALDDDGDATAPGSVTFDDLAAGVHTITAVAVPGYTSTVTCSDPDGGSTVSGLTATVDLDPLETVTCTFTHTLDADTGDGGAGGVILASPAEEEPAVVDASPAAVAATAVAAQPLAVTGSESLPMAQIAFATIGIGLSIVAADRTRRRRSL